MALRELDQEMYCRIKHKPLPQLEKELTIDRILLHEVRGYEPYYISNAGLAWAPEREYFHGSYGPMRKKARWLKKHREHYQTYYLTTANWSGQVGTHILVALAWIGPKPFPKAEVRHLDGNDLNNYYLNLKWGTALENSADMLLHGTRKTYLTKNEVTIIKLELKNNPRRGLQADLARRFNVSITTIGKIYDGITWSHIRI